jgi:hypothetical protein
MVYTLLTSGCADIKTKKGYDDLELEAQPNVDADKYAGDFHLANKKFDL